MHPESLTQFPLEMVALFLSNNTSLPQKTLTAPSCTNCCFYCSDLNDLNSSKWVMMLWENTALEWVVVCRCPFVAGSRSGRAFSSAFRAILKVCTAECNLCAATICRVTEHTHCNCSMGIVLDAQAIWEGSAGWGSWMWSNDQTSAEEPPQWCCRYRATSSSLQVVPWVKSSPDNEKACSKANGCVEESMKMHMAQQPCAVWLKGNVRKRLGLH